MVQITVKLKSIYMMNKTSNYYLASPKAWTTLLIIQWLWSQDCTATMQTAIKSLEVIRKE